MAGIDEIDIFGTELPPSWRTLDVETIRRILALLSLPVSFAANLMEILRKVIANACLVGVCNACGSDYRHLRDCSTVVALPDEIVFDFNPHRFAQTGTLEMAGLSESELLYSLFDFLDIWHFTGRSRLWADDMTPEDTKMELGRTKVGPILLLVMKYFHDHGIYQRPDKVGDPADDDPQWDAPPQ